MKNSILNLAKYLIGWPLSAISLYFVFRLVFTHFESIQASIKEVNLGLLSAGVFCFLIFYVLRSLKWHLILSVKGQKLSFVKSTYLWAISELRRYTPGNIWAVLGRTVLFSREGIEKKTVITAMVAEISIVLVATALVSILSFPFLITYVFPGNSLMYLLFRLGSFFIIIGSLLFVFQKMLVAGLPDRLGRITDKLLPLFPPQTTFTITAITALACVFFGLGYYFSIASVVNLNLQDLWILSGFFVLSLLLGFLSFLTPAGLGVREGVVTVGLGLLMPLSVAGFAAIFARIMLILTELLFVLVSFLLMKIKETRITLLEQKLASNMHMIVLFFATSIFILYFTITSFARHDNFYTGRFDLGNMAQTVWNTTQGRFFQFTNPDGAETVSRLAFHADFILALMAPFYAIWPSPKVLLLIQAVVVGLGSIFIYLIGKQILKDRTISLVIAISYLLYPALQRATLYDFHAVALAPTFFLGAFYFIIRNKYIPAIVFLVLAAFTKEQIWFIVALFGIYIAVVKKSYLLGSVLTVGSIGMFYYLIWHAIPSSYGGDHFALSYFSELGDSPGSVIKTILLDPVKVMNIAFTESRIDYLRQLLVPLGYLPVFWPIPLIFAAPDLIINLLSNNEQLHQIYYQYTSGITPFLFISMIYACYYLRRFFPAISFSAFSIYLLLAAVYGAYLYGPLPGARGSNLAMYTKQVPGREEYKSVIRQIPQEASVVATNNLGAHFSEREHIYAFPYGLDKADFAAFLLNDKNAQPPLEVQLEAVRELRQDPRYSIYYEDKDFIIFQKLSDFASTL